MRQKNCHSAPPRTMSPMNHALPGAIPNVSLHSLANLISRTTSYAPGPGPLPSLPAAECGRCSSIGGGVPNPGATTVRNLESAVVPRVLGILYWPGAGRRSSRVCGRCCQEGGSAVKHRGGTPWSCVDVAGKIRKRIDGWALSYCRTCRSAAGS